MLFLTIPLFMPSTMLSTVMEAVFDGENVVIGRELQCKQLQRLLQVHGSKIIVLNGPTGSGKTHVVRWFLSTLPPDEFTCTMISCDDVIDNSSFFATVITALRTALAPSTPIDQPQRLSSFDFRAALRRLFAESPRYVLLVIFWAYFWAPISAVTTDP